MLISRFAVGLVIVMLWAGPSYAAPRTVAPMPLPLPIEVSQVIEPVDTIVHNAKPVGAKIIVLKAAEGAISTHWLMRAGMHDLAGMPTAGVTIDDGTASIRIFAGNRLEFTVPDDVDVITLRSANSGALLTYWWL